MENLVNTFDKMVSFYKGKKIFITGHTGFKGSWLSIWLNELEAEIYGYALKPDTIPNNYHLCNLQNLIPGEFNDVKNYVVLKKALTDFQPELVFHLAAQPLVRRSYKDSKYTFDTNINGVTNLLESIKDIRSVKAIVIVTSDKCYENKESIHGYTEGDELGGDDPYSASKACAEIISNSYYKSFFKNKKVGIGTARAGNVIGGGDWSEDRIIPDLIRAIAKKEEVLIRNPYSVRPWQHVLESLYGYLSLALNLYENPIEYSGAYNFGPSKEKVVDVITLINECFNLWGIEQTCILDNNFNNILHETNYLMLDWSKAKNKLGWKPVWNVDTALFNTINWYKKYYNGEKNIFEVCKNNIKLYLLDAGKIIMNK